MSFLMTTSRHVQTFGRCAVRAAVALSVGVAGCGGGDQKSVPDAKPDAPAASAREDRKSTRLNSSH